MEPAAGVPRLAEDIPVTVGEPGETVSQVWMCEPPAPAVGYVVVRDHWEDDYTKRVIDEIRLV